MKRSFCCWLILLLLATAAWPADRPGRKSLDPAEDFKTVDQAVTTRISKTTVVGTTAQPSFLGIDVTLNKDNQLVIGEIAAESPAAKAGLLRGDILKQFDGNKLAGLESLQDMLQSKAPGDSVNIAFIRKDRVFVVTATLGAVSRPLRLDAQKVTLGVQVSEGRDGEGVIIQQVTQGSPAAKAKLKAGEIILKIDGVALNGPEKLREILSQKKPEDTVVLSVRADDKVSEVKVQLAAEYSDVSTGGWDSRIGAYWKKEVYRIAFVPVEYPDTKHSSKIASTDWEEALFSRNAYTKTSSTGQTVYGSLNDYYQEQSYGGLHVEGKVFAYVEVSKKRSEYLSGDKNQFFTEALDKLLERDGKEALKDFDGLLFLYSGERAQAARGSLYWPHRASCKYQGKNWPYFICAEGGNRMTNISVFCHEFGHLLGLPDLYARPEVPGSEGVGQWCAMSNEINNGRPQHFCAWSKEKLGWIKPAVIDPTVKQKLILSPVEDSGKECFKVLVRPDGSEYFLIENRKKKGFDQSLPGEGLLIWRVVGDRPLLVESHGVEGPAGPRVYLEQVPFPTSANDAFTPFTTPSSRSQLGAGLPVNITNIRRLPDGRITFYIGYEYE